jgi:hypothetical protein
LPGDRTTLLVEWLRFEIEACRSYRDDRRRGGDRFGGREFIAVFTAGSNAEGPFQFGANKPEEFD